MKRITLVLSAVLVVMAGTSLLHADPYPAPYFNSFENESDVSSMVTADDDPFFTVARVPSGTDGIPSAFGDFHAVANATDFGNPDGFVYTRFGGYSSVFPPDGYTTSLDIYLDPADSPVGQDLRLDWSSAISSPSGNHRRDFIFSIGTDQGGGYVASASNNAPGWPANPGRDPVYLTGGEWYTFVHRFYDSGGGVLAVDMSVVDAAGDVLKSWTLSDPSDVIGTTVGGNRYGWLVTSDFDALAIDNATRSGAVPMYAQDCKNDGWQSVFRPDGSGFKNQGDCIQFVNTGK